MSFSPTKGKTSITLLRHRNKVWLISGLAIFLSILGFIFSTLNPSIGLPLRLGLDFTGGTQIRLDRQCFEDCSQISSQSISESLRFLEFEEKADKSTTRLSEARVQSLDGDKSLLIRLPSISPSESKQVIELISKLAGPLEVGGQSVETIGPTLGAELLRTTLISLLVAFSGVAVYITIRFDRQFSFYALLALLHDLIIIIGTFSWLGIISNVEVNSLFAVALLTIAGYSVNDTVVVFDRIREISKQDNSLSYKQKIDLAVSATLTRTLYTSGTTLLPLFALIFFGGATLYWFSIALALGVVVGSWSSIALVPSLLSLKKDN